MLAKPNFLFVSRKLAPKDREEDTGRCFYKAAMLCHFVFIEEEDGTHTVYKNSYDGKQHTGWSYEQCLDLIDMCYNLRLKELNEEDSQGTRTV